MKQIQMTRDFTYAVDESTARTLPQGLRFTVSDKVAKEAIAADCAVIVAADGDADLPDEPVAGTQFFEAEPKGDAGKPLGEEPASTRDVDTIATVETAKATDVKVAEGKPKKGSSVVPLAGEEAPDA